MLRLNIFQFYRFGYYLRQLDLVDEDSEILDVYRHLLEAKDTLIDVLGQRTVPVQGLKQSVDDLIRIIDNIMHLLEKDNSTGHEKIGSRASKLHEAFRRFEILFEAEIVSRGLDVYAVSPKGLYSTPLLIDSADSVILEDLRPFLPETAQYDLRQSGKCLAFEVPTASAFHVLRAAEAVIKLYYKSLTNEEWETSHRESQRNWGNYIDALKNSGAKATITASLDQIRTLYRNPIVHPEEKLDMGEAISLFNQTSSIMTIILKEVRDLSA